MDIANALLFKFPGTKWKLTGNVYSGLDWRDEVTPKPTLQQIKDAWAELTAPPPLVVSMRSFREACGRSLVIQITAFVASIQDVNERFLAQNDLEFALTVSRNHPRVAQLAAALGKADSEIDAVFETAKQIDASR